MAEESMSDEVSLHHVKTKRRYPYSKKLMVGKGKKVKNGHQTKPTVNLVHVVQGFHINLLKTPEHPTLTELDELDLNGVLTSLLSFTSAESITATDAIDKVLKLEIRSLTLECLLLYKSYELPEKYDGCDITHRAMFATVKDRIRGLLQQMERTQEIISSCDMLNDKVVQHDCRDNVKNFFNVFFNFAFEGLMSIYNGQTAIELPLVKMEGTTNDDLRSVDGCEILVNGYSFVQSKPDIVIGRDYRYPVISVEVYSTEKYLQNTSKTSRKDEESELEESGSSLKSSSVSNLSSSECVTYLKAIKKYLNENLPTDFPAGVSRSCLDEFREKLIEQLLIQLLGCSHNYILERRFAEKSNPSQFRKKHTFLGFFAYQFNIYIVKLEGKYVDIDDICRADRSWHRQNKGNFPLGVSFYPLALDMRKPSHGIALLLFIRYYREVWQH